METIVLILIISSFAWWCFSQGSKPRKRKEVEARSEDMYRRYIEKDAELRANSLTPSAKATARSQAKPTFVQSRAHLDYAKSVANSGAPSATKHSAAKPLTPDQARRIAANIAKLPDLLR